jgi:hypothetical protein
MGDAACAPKNGGLNVHNDSITARVMGDATRATKLGDATSTSKLLPPGNGGCRVCTKNGGLNVHSESLAAIGRGGMPLGQQTWGTHCPQQNYRHQAMGDAAFVRKKMGDSMSTMKVSPLGQGGTPLGRQNGGTQRPQQNYCRWAMGDATFAPKKWVTQCPQLKYRCLGKEGRRSGNETGGLNVHNKIIAAGRWGMPRLCQKMGDSTSTMKVLPLRQRGRPHGHQGRATLRPRQN